MFISKELLFSAAEKFGVKISDEQAEKFNLYAEILVDYNKKVNLTAITNADEIVIKHFADSLAVCKFSPVKLNGSLADVGTGAGFPGLPLLIVNEGLKVTFFDAVNKKLDFIRLVLSELDLKADVVHSRAEDAGRDDKYRENFDFATARAVAQLRILSEYCLPLIKTGGLFFSMKGLISDEERETGIAACSKLGSELYDSVFYNIHNGDERNLIILKKVSQISPKYPRNMSQISKKPL